MGNQIKIRGSLSPSLRPKAHGPFFEPLESRLLLSVVIGGFIAPEFDFLQPGGLGSSATVTYSYSNLFDGNLGGGFDESQLRSVVEEALSLWASVVPVHFIEIADSGLMPNGGDSNYNAYLSGSSGPRHAEIRIGHETLPGGVAAHASIPATHLFGLEGDIHLNSGQDWALEPSIGLDIRQIVIHELGHSLGLGESDVSSAIMKGTYTARFTGGTAPFLFQDDIDGVRVLYGAGAGSVTPLGTSTPELVLATNAGITLDEGTTTLIDKTVLEATDTDNSADEIIFTLTSNSTNGRVKLNGADLNTNDTFSQEDVNNDLLTYEHDGGETTLDSIGFTVTDGEGNNIAETTFNITINALNDTPTLDTNLTLVLNEEATASITNAQLEVSDSEQGDADLIFTLTSVATKGLLKLNGSTLNANDTFTQVDIDNNLVTYEHDGSETTSDSFDFTVSDGAGGSIAQTTFNITINAVNDAPTLDNPISDFDAPEGQFLTFEIPSDTFSDVDPGDTLNLDATLSDASDLPAWLTFNNDTHRFTGTPTLADLGTLDIDVTADDGNGGTVTDTLRISVADITPPRVVSVVQNGGDAQRSTFRELAVVFSEDVNVTTAALTLENLNSGEFIDVSDMVMIYDAGTKTATWTFPGLTGGSVPDGIYRATLQAALITDGVGHNLDGDSNGVGGDNYTETLFRLFGDGDGDTDVDSADLFAFRTTLFLNDTSPSYNSLFDHDIDGDVDSADLFRFRSNLFTNLAPPESSSEPAQSTMLNLALFATSNSNNSSRQVGAQMDSPETGVKPKFRWTGSAVFHYSCRTNQSWCNTPPETGDFSV